MKAQLVHENLDFERGGDPKRSMKIGLSQIIFDKWNEFQLQPGIGSINLEKSLNKNWHLDLHVSLFPGAPSKTYKLANKYFGDYLNDGYNFKKGKIKIMIKPEYVKNFMDAYNMRYPDWPIEINESVNFERTGTPYEKMGIGKKAYLEQRAKEIDWDWEPPFPDEEILDIIEYKGFNIKISKIIHHDGNIIYFADCDTGEPYLVPPEFHKDPEQALFQVQHFLDEYSEQ